MSLSLQAGPASKIAVVLIIYNRPELVRETFAVIRAYQPAHLYVIADGPRDDRPGDAAAVEAARAEIVNDWGATLTLDYADTNLGCQQRVYTGLNSVFERYERAIILEDDCRPHPDFFPFCTTLLEHYAADPKVMHIAGSNFLDARYMPGDYTFTYHPTPWGWATWRRAWQQIDLEMNAFFENADLMRKRLGIGRRSLSKLYRRLDRVRQGALNSWAYPWMASCLAHEGLSIQPRTNLVSNLGFDPRSTHTSNPQSFFARRPLEAIDRRQLHEASAQLDPIANREAFYLFFGGGYRQRGRWRDRLGI